MTADAPAEKKPDKKPDCTANPADNHADVAKAAETKCRDDAQTPSPASTKDATSPNKTDSTTAAATKTDTNPIGTDAKNDGKDKQDDPEHKEDGDPLIWSIANDLGLSSIQKYWNNNRGTSDLLPQFPGADALAKQIGGDKLAKGPAKPVDTTAANPGADTTKPVALDGVKPADSTKPESTSWLDSFGDWTASSISAVTPDVLERPIVSLTNNAFDLSCKAGDWLGDWATDLFSSSGLGLNSQQSKQLAKEIAIAAKAPGKIPVHSKTFNEFNDVENSVKLGGGSDGLFDKAKDKGVTIEKVDGQTTYDNKLNDRLKEIGHGVTADSLRNLIKGLEGPTEKRVDSVTGETVEIDSAKNQRIVDKAGNVTLKLQDGTIINQTTDAKSGQKRETIILPGDKGFMRTMTDKDGQVSREAVLEAGVLRKEIGLVQFISSTDGFNITQANENPDAIISAKDRTTFRDDESGVHIGIDKPANSNERGDVLITSPDGNEIRLRWDRETRTAKFLRRDAAGKETEIAEKDLPSYITRKDGKLWVGGTEVNRDLIRQLKLNGVRQEIKVDSGGTVTAQGTDTNTNQFIKTVDKPDGHSEITDSNNEKRDFDHNSGLITGTNSDGSEFKWDPKTGEIKSQDLNRDDKGTVRINSSGTELRGDGSITNNGRTLLDSAGHWGSGMEECSDSSAPKGRAADTAREQNRVATAKAIQSASFASMAMSLLGAGPASVSMMLNYAFMADSALQGAKAMINMSSGFDLTGITSMVAVSSAQGSVNEAKSAGQRANATVHLANSNGIFSADDQTRAIGQITGSIGLSPSAVVLNLSEARMQRQSAEQSKIS
jgi:hypothetical protein